MRKLSDIAESVWVDMHKISTGETIRKEDDVNNLDIKGLYEYIKNKYNKKGHLLTCDPVTLDVSIAIDYTTNIKPTNIKIGLYWNDDSKKLYIWSSKPVIEDISKKFELEQSTSIQYRLKQEGEELTNSMIISVIDSILESCSNYINIEILLDYDEDINESIWADMHRVSTGEMIRKENIVDVDLLDNSEFFEYLKSHYKCNESDTISFNKSSGLIDIRLFEYRPFIYKYLQYYMDRNEIVTDIPSSDDIFQELNKHFKVIYRFGFNVIYPNNNDEDVTNKFFLEVLDCIIENINCKKEIDKL